MRFALLLTAFLAVAGLAAQDNTEPEKRYGFEISLEGFPQAKPEETLKSVIKAVQENKIDYLLARLADPTFVDKQVAEKAALFQGKEEAKKILGFNMLVKQTEEHFRDDPTLVRELKTILEKGEWSIENDQGVAKFALLPGRAVFVKQIMGRWFLENKQK